MLLTTEQSLQPAYQVLHTVINGIFINHCVAQARFNLIIPPPRLQSAAITILHSPYTIHNQITFSVPPEYKVSLYIYPQVASNSYIPISAS